MVAEALEASHGSYVKVIEPDPQRCDEISRALAKALVIAGDGTNLDLLESEGVAESRVLVAVTNSDERNLLISLLGKQLGIPRIVTRAGTAANERLFERVGIDVVRSAQGTAIQSVLADLTGGRSRLLAEVEHGDARILELEVPAGMPPRRLREMHAPVFAIVGAILRGRETLIPRGDDEVRSGDRIVVFCDAAAEEAARTFFERAPEGD
jgi:trk system potassium uptake protein TrkA